VSSGDILVFSDATTRLSPSALNRIVRGFADPEVGCVAGQLDYTDPADSGIGLGCRRYWNWEKQIRLCESRLGSLIGVSGCFYAVRRSCFRNLSGDMIDDFVIASEIHLQGLRTVYDPEALAMEYTHQHAEEEFRMRVRIIEQSLSALRHYSKPLSRRWDLFRFQLVSHKWLRYLAPVFLVAAYFSNLLLVKDGALYTVSFFGMTAALFVCPRWLAYGSAVPPRGPLMLPYYFVLANLAPVLLSSSSQVVTRVRCGSRCETKWSRALLNENLVYVWNRRIRKTSWDGDAARNGPSHHQADVRCDRAPRPG
jgi:cellulose synthase/poly-beta-1,6-N-acetylglucosamine synthase-like glycosyltransferase